MRSDHRIARLGRGSHAHLSDNQLMETYVTAGDDRHLASCAPCQTRFDALVRTLEHVREDATHEADGIFSAERMHDQRDRIMRRLERHDHPAAVVQFPNRSVIQPTVHRLISPVRRWVAGAAAAGLAAGMFLGFALDRRTHDFFAANQVIQRPAPLAVQASDTGDDQFFNEIDEALIGSRAREMRPDLGAIDVMTTPLEIREVSYVRE